MRPSLYLTALLALGCADDGPAPEAAPPAAPDAPADAKADGTGGGLLHTSMSTVEALDGDLSSVDPPVRQVFVGDPTSPQTYLRTMSCLGYYGPIGPYGPLGLLGPVGEADWNPSKYITGDVDWNVFHELLDENEGPLTADGPLGENGPLNTARWSKLGVTAGEREDAANTYSPDFVTQLAPGGVWSVLGPVGPLGALGPLGPLGPIGAHGYRSDGVGNYLPVEGECQDGGTICRTYDVEWTPGGEVRTYELFEMYPEKTAAAMTDNDTSFMAVGSIRRPKDGPDSYEFTSRSNQWVTVNVVPHYARFTYPEAMTILFQSAAIGFNVPAALTFYPFVYDHQANFDDFDLTVEILGANGEVVSKAVSNSGDRADWIQFRAQAGTRIRARVELYRAWWQIWRTVSPEYRLMVVGSTPYVNSLPILGDHHQQ